MTRIRKQPDSADTLNDKQRGEANKYLYSDIQIYSLLRVPVVAALFDSF